MLGRQKHIFIETVYMYINKTWSTDLKYRFSSCLTKGKNCQTGINYSRLSSMP